MNRFKKQLIEETPISPSQKQRIKNAVLSRKGTKRNARIMPLVASVMFGIIVIVGSFMLLTGDLAPTKTGTSPQIELTSIYGVMVDDTKSVSPENRQVSNLDLYYYDESNGLFQKGNFNVFTSVPEGDLHIGDLVKVHRSENEELLIGNIIATPNDRVEIKNGELYINDKRFNQYLFAGMDATAFEANDGKVPVIKLPEKVDSGYIISSYDWVTTPLVLAEQASALFKIEHIQRPSTDEREQVANYLESGDEGYLVGVSPEMILKTYLFTLGEDGSRAPEVEVLALSQFEIEWPSDLAYHEEKFDEMLEAVPANVYKDTASMHIKGWDIPFITLEFTRENDVWKISKLE
ncbi:S26 family signal peptidase [Lysinibacillus sp. 54212]|uniref:S26 family signal peptidase n=1 Tax=Lysinibacillus sp. 54212 TaxID=3119829 RepID=UPI002FCC99A3